MDGPRLADELRAAMLPGMRVYGRNARPTSSVFAGTQISGVQFSIVNRDQIQPTRLGLEIAATLTKLYPERVNIRMCTKLIGNESVLSALERGVQASDVWKAVNRSLDEFRESRKAYLIY